MGSRSKPGIKWANKKAATAAQAMWNEINSLSIKECEAIIEVAEGFSATNCGWTSYQCKSAIIDLCKHRIGFLKSLAIPLKKRKEAVKSLLNKIDNA